MKEGKEVDLSVINMWEDFVQKNHGIAPSAVPPSFYFCDNKTDADECLDLVLQGVKKATATALWWYDYHDEPLPIPDDYYVITSWEGIAKCIVQVTQVDVVKFRNVSATFAKIEGEGDKSLAYWRKVHKAYYERELAEHPEMHFREDMMIVCEQFHLVYSD